MTSSCQVFTKHGGQTPDDVLPRGSRTSVGQKGNVLIDSCCRAQLQTPAKPAGSREQGRLPVSETNRTHVSHTATCWKQCVFSPFSVLNPALHVTSQLTFFQFWNKLHPFHPEEKILLVIHFWKRSLVPCWNCSNIHFNRRFKMSWDAAFWKFRFYKNSKNRSVSVLSF